MIRYVLLLILAVKSLTLIGQDISELQRRNGFKDLTLGMHLDTVNGEKRFKKKIIEQGQFNAKLFVVKNPEYDQIGEIPTHEIQIKTYKDLVYQIDVITKKDARLMKALESVYGLAHYDLKNKVYFWRAESLVLKFKSHSNNRLKLTFTSYAILNMMKEDKEEKVHKIAEDF